MPNGDRMMRALLVFEILYLATALLLPSPDTLKKVLVVYRHGDRAPIADFPTDPNRNYKWTDGLGNLTTLGKTEALTLGTTLRRRYSGFLNTNNVNQAYARSSSYLRCIYTTICVLTAIYEPDKPQTCYNGTGYTPGPVYTVEPGPNDHMLYASPYCPRNSLESAKVFTSPAYLSFLKQNQDLLVELQNLTGIANLKNPENLLDLYDTLIVERAHDLPLPSWVDRLFPDIRKLAIPLYNFFSYTDELVKLQAGVLLNDILTQLKEPAVGQYQRLFLYGTHDIIVLPTLKILRVSNDLPPPYTAAIIIELHEMKTPLRKISQCVQIFYRNTTTEGTPLKMAIRGCPQECCPLGTFFQLTQTNAVADPEKYCSLQPGSNS